MASTAEEERMTSDSQESSEEPAPYGEDDEAPEVGTPEFDVWLERMMDSATEDKELYRPRLKDRLKEVDFVGSEDAGELVGALLEEEWEAREAALTARQEAELNRIREVMDQEIKHLRGGAAASEARDEALRQNPRAPSGDGVSEHKARGGVLLIGALLVLLSGIYPPFEGEIRVEGDNLKTFMGYYPIFAPPSASEVAGRFGVRGREGRWTVEERSHAYVAMSRVGLQIAVIVLCTVALALAVPKSRVWRASKRERSGQGFDIMAFVRGIHGVGITVGLIAGGAWGAYRQVVHVGKTVTWLIDPIFISTTFYPSVVLEAVGASVVGWAVVFFCVRHARSIGK
jgi:hypothetical protein